MKPAIAIHPKTSKAMSLLARKPTGSILIVGPSGSGKVELAKNLAQRVLAISSDLDTYPHFRHIKKDESKQEISIDAVRGIIKFIKLKIPGSGIQRVILIEDAQFLSVEAQNSILKILEEPHDDTVFILTTSYEPSLLPTIVSRCQKIKAYPITQKQVTAFYGNDYSSSKLESAWRLSQGRAKLLNALLNDDDSHPLKQAVETAKQFLRRAKSERLLMLDKFDREEMQQFLEALSRVLAALYYSSQQKQKKSAKNLLADRRTVQEIIKAYELNANQRLANLKLLTDLSI